MHFSAGDRFPRNRLALVPSPGQYDPVLMSRETGRWNTRQRVTTPMQGSDANRSLNGMDTLNTDAGPAPGSYEVATSIASRKPHETVGKTQSFLFGSNTSRFLRTRKADDTAQCQYGDPHRPQQRKILHRAPKSGPAACWGHGDEKQATDHDPLNRDEWCDKKMHERERVRMEKEKGGKTITEQRQDLQQTTRQPHRPSAIAQRHRRRRHRAVKAAVSRPSTNIAKQRREAARQKAISEVAALDQFRPSDAPRPRAKPAVGAVRIGAWV
jgi:hypothetical protein